MKFTVFAPLLHRALGDFIEHALMASTIAARFDEGRMLAYFRPDRPYKQHVLSLLPHIAATWVEDDGPGPVMDFWDIAAHPPVVADPQWYSAGAQRPDLVLTPSMARREYLPEFWPFAQMKDPAVTVDGLEDQTGGGWFVVLHYREPGYEHRIDRPQREIAIPEVEALIDHVIRSGGQVIRIGHPQMTELRPRAGFIDMKDAHFYQQCTAIARARFFLEASPSGPAALSLGYGVPWLRCNALGFEGPAAPGSILLHQHVIDDNGREVPTVELMECGAFSEAMVKTLGWSFRKNTVDEMTRAIDTMINETAATTGWRDPADRNPLVATNNLPNFPWPKTRSHRIVRWSGDNMEAQDHALSA